MGRDKSRMLLGGKTFLDRTVSMVRELDIAVEIIDRDDLPGLGPLGGVSTAFRRFPCRAGLFLSCDMPLLDAPALQQFVKQCDSDALFTSVDKQPGFPFFLPAQTKATTESLVSGGRRSIRELASAVDGRFYDVPVAERWQFLNVNTPEDYEQARKLWQVKRRNPNSVLNIRRLTVRRGRTVLVSEFSWAIQKGQHWVLLGPNGCGKTSLLSSLLGYLTPSSGEIHVLGQEYGDFDWTALRKKIGVVSSSVRQMMPETEPAWITVASGKYAMIDFWGTPAKRDKKAALRLLRDIECEHIAERPWVCLSQGERQRVLIGRALIGNPALLILDEPCAGLDPAARENFLRFIDRLGRKPGGPALVLVTHHVEEVMPVFTHALLMKQGRKAYEGEVRRVLRSERLSETFETKMNVHRRECRFTVTVQPKESVIL